MSLRSLLVSPLRVRLMLPTAVAREFLGMDDEEEIRSQLMLPMLAFLWKAFRRPLPLLQHESGRSAGIGEGGSHACCAKAPNYGRESIARKLLRPALRGSDLWWDFSDAHISGGIAPKSIPSLRSHPTSPLRVRLMLPTAVAREFLGMDDEEEIRSQRRPLPLLQHESGRSAGFGEVGPKPAALRQLIRAG